MPLTIIEKTFEKSYAYYVAGLRMYFVLVPMFAWLVSSWLLLAITLPHLYIVYRYDNLDWLEDEVGELYSTYQPLLAEEKQQQHHDHQQHPTQSRLAPPQQTPQQQIQPQQLQSTANEKKSTQTEVEIISIQTV